MTEKRLEQMENIEHISCIQTDVDWNTEDASCWVAESTDWSDQANEQLEPLTDTDGDETMMDNLGDDGARGNWCGQIEKPTNEAIGSRYCCTRGMRSLIHIEIGAALVLVALDGRTLTNDRVKNKTVYLWRAWIIGSSRLLTTASTPRAPLRFRWHK